MGDACEMPLAVAVNVALSSYDVGLPGLVCVAVLVHVYSLLMGILMHEYSFSLDMIY